MKFDQFGQSYTSTNLLADSLYQNPDLNLENVLVTDPEQYNHSIDILHCDLAKLKQYIKLDISVEQFDKNNQRNWYMPQEYYDLDIAKHVLDLCSTPVELQRVGQELLLYQERNLFPLLCYLKYLVDILRTNQIVWGVGRGSSTASYVLYLIGVHKINSIYYDLPIEEFLKG